MFVYKDNIKFSQYQNLNDIYINKYKYYTSDEINKQIVYGFKIDKLINSYYSNDNLFNIIGYKDGCCKCYIHIQDIQDNNIYYSIIIGVENDDDNNLYKIEMLRNYFKFYGIKCSSIDFIKIFNDFQLYYDGDKYSFSKLKDSYIYNVNNNYYINNDFDTDYK